MELSATVVLIIITCISSYYAWKTPGFMNRSLFSPFQINKKKEYDRFILSGFIHRDSVHLLFNMFTFYFFGRLIEQFLTYRLGMIPGIAVFVIFYLAAMVVADIPTYVKHKENYHYNALGASGGVAAAVFASIILMPMADICLFGLICLPGFVLGFLFLIYSIYKSRQESDGINHDAHLYGAIFGILFILILSPSSAIHFFDQIKDFRLF